MYFSERPNIHQCRVQFHSDAEKGLGPNVASLSLGASAEMYFRLHPKFSGELLPGSSRDVLKLHLRHVSLKPKPDAVQCTKLMITTGERACHGRCRRSKFL